MKRVRIVIIRAKERIDMQLEAFIVETDIERSNISHLKHRKTGLEVVRKTIAVQQGIEEINYLKRFNCNYFPTLLDFEVNAHQAHIYMVKVNGVRWDRVCQDKKLHQYIVENIEQVTRNAMHLLTVLKNERIIHGDVKPDNLFVDEALNVKLIDFGSAMDEENEVGQMRHMGTHMYMAPESILASERISCISDCYGMGRSILKLIGNKQDQCEMELISKIKGLSSIRPDNRKFYFESFKIFTCKTT